MGLPRPPQRGGQSQTQTISHQGSGVAKNISHSDFGGDTTRCAQTVSPLFEILAPFLTHRHNAEGTDPATLVLFCL